MSECPNSICRECIHRTWMEQRHPPCHPGYNSSIKGVRSLDVGVTDIESDDRQSNTLHGVHDNSSDRILEVKNMPAIDKTGMFPSDGTDIPYQSLPFNAGNSDMEELPESKISSSSISDINEKGRILLHRV